MDEQISWGKDGTLSTSEFSESARAFAEKWVLSNPASPPWRWVKCPRVDDGYLSLESICVVKSIDVEGNDEEAGSLAEGESGLIEEDESTDSATLVQSSDLNNVHHYYFDFHIIYSASFRVPVLYFRAYRSDGGSLGSDEIERALPANSAKFLLDSKWTFITQEEHPYLNRPWYKLHPCGSSEWMKLLFQAEERAKKPGAEMYLLSWFSVVGPVLGIGLQVSDP